MELSLSNYLYLSHLSQQEGHAPGPFAKECQLRAEEESLFSHEYEYLSYSLLYNNLSPKISLALFLLAFSKALET